MLLISILCMCSAVLNSKSLTFHLQSAGVSFWWRLRIVNGDGALKMCVFHTEHLWCGLKFNYEKGESRCNVVSDKYQILSIVTGGNVGTNYNYK